MVEQTKSAKTQAGIVESVKMIGSSELATLLHGQFRGRSYSVCISDVIEGVSSIKQVVFGLGIYTNTDSRCPRNLEFDEIIWHQNHREST